MENSKKNDSLFLTMGCVTIVDAGIIINKHIKLNEIMPLKPIYEALQDAGLFKMKTKRQMNEIFSELCEFMNYGFEFRKMKIDNNIVSGVVVFQKKIEKPKKAKITIKIKIKK